jgi:hypothetical protein
MAADRGHANAQGFLGWAYSHGEGVAQDDVVAFDWFQKSANQGNASAEALLGLAYFRGKGVQQDRDQGIALWSAAAAQGNPIGELNLGSSYFLGVGVAKDEGRALSLWRAAASRGNAQAQKNLTRAAERQRERQEAEARIDRLAASASAQESALRRQEQIDSDLTRSADEFGRALGCALAGGCRQDSGNLTCRYDSQCGAGDRCVKPRDAFGDGVCVRPVDEFGMPSVDTPEPSIGPHETTGCMSNIDCDIGFKCRKMASGLNGLCVR